ncbi:MAG: GTP-binding protein [Prevotella sp.]|nr:GTP-binding protein [Prevotella sp.]
MKKQIPVLLLTGYLGSGKTTLLNRILRNERGYKFAVIVNDIGEVNIDAGLIEKGGVVNESDESLVALQNGCICCTLKMDLARQLCDIARSERFDYIVIEASGICEPLPIAQTICSIPYMQGSFVGDTVPVLDCIATVVDALRMVDEFGAGSALTADNIGEEDIENLVIRQIEFCNIVLLNKASMVSKDNLGRTTEIVRALQPGAEIIPCDYGDVDLDRIVGTGMFDFNSVATSAAWIKEIDSHGEEDNDDDDENEEEHGAHHHHHHHEHGGGETEEYGIGTYVYYARPPFDISAFDDFVARRWDRNIIRAKGLCYFATETHICYLFEQAGRQFDLKNCGQWYATMAKDELESLLEREPGLRKDWDAKYGDRMQKIVFIGQHLDKETIKEELDACLAE